MRLPNRRRRVRSPGPKACPHTSLGRSPRCGIQPPRGLKARRHVPVCQTGAHRPGVRARWCRAFSPPSFPVIDPGLRPGLVCLRAFGAVTSPPSTPRLAAASTDINASQKYQAARNHPGRRLSSAVLATCPSAFLRVPLLILGSATHASCQNRKRNPICRALAF